MVSIIPKFWKNNSIDSAKGIFICCCGCILITCTFGMGNSYPMFIKKIKDDPEYASDPPSETILAMGTSLLLGVNPVFTILFGGLNRYIGTRIPCIICACFLFSSYFVPSFISDYRGVVVTFGLLMAVSYGVALNAPGVVASTWLILKKPVGMGIVFSGGGLGNLIVPPILGYLIDEYGWRSTLRRISFLGVPAFCAALFMVQRRAPDVKEDEVDKKNHEKGMNLEENTSNVELNGGSGVIDISRTDQAININENDNEENKEGNAQNKDKETTKENVENAGDNNNAVNEPPQIPSAGEINNGSDPSHEPDHGSGIENIEEDRCLNTHRCTVKEFIFDLLLSKAYISLFITYLLYALGFYGILFLLVPYPAFWIGKEGTIYENYPKISLKSAAFGSIAYGLGRLTGGPIVGIIATKLTDRYTYSLFAFFHGALIAILMAARQLYAFIILYFLLGFCVGGFYATFFSLVARRFYGPNLGLAMGIMLVATIPGGFISPIVTASVLDRHQNFNYSLLFFSLSSVASSAIVFITMEDRIGHPVVLGEGFRQLQARRERLGKIPIVV